MKQCLVWSVDFAHPGFVEEQIAEKCSEIKNKWKTFLKYTRFHLKKKVLYSFYNTQMCFPTTTKLCATSTFYCVTNTSARWDSAVVT